MTSHRVHATDPRLGPGVFELEDLLEALCLTTPSVDDDAPPLPTNFVEVVDLERDRGHQRRRRELVPASVQGPIPTRNDAAGPLETGPANDWRKRSQPPSR
ncbi:MAG TPA: hypothetical protein VJM33_05800 [Microthrixaceae bacterium]|nr:hypothetical protein [Microthrixaceae bacterium]